MSNLEVYTGFAEKYKSLRRSKCVIQNHYSYDKKERLRSSTEVYLGSLLSGDINLLGIDLDNAISRGEIAEEDAKNLRKKYDEAIAKFTAKDSRKGQLITPDEQRRLLETVGAYCGVDPKTIEADLADVENVYNEEVTKTRNNPYIYRGSVTLFNSEDSYIDRSGSFPVYRSLTLKSDNFVNKNALSDD